MISEFQTSDDAIRYVVEAFSRVAPEDRIDVEIHPRGVADALPAESTCVDTKRLSRELKKYCSDFPAALVAFDTEEYDVPVAVIELLCDESAPVGAGMGSELASSLPIVSAFLHDGSHEYSRDEKRAAIRFLHRQMRDWRRAQSESAASGN